MAELQRRGVGDGPDRGIRERRRPLPIQRAAGDSVPTWRSPPSVGDGEDSYS